MANYQTKDIRNIALMGHGSEGKTTLTEALLFAAKAIDRQGRVEDGNTVTDFDPEEIKRGISISAATAPIEWKQKMINIIDVPGYFDFIGEAMGPLRVVETAGIVVSAVGGISVGAEKAWKLATKNHVAKMFIVNQMDREHADFHKVEQALRENALTVKGKGAHCSFPEQGVDAIVTTAQLILALQTISARRVEATDPVIVSICQANAGTAYNILPDEMTLTGAVRSFDPAVRERIKALIGEIPAGITASAGASYDYVWDAGYASVFNDEKLTALAEQTLLSRFGKEHIDHIGPIMPGEDFYAFLENRPGFFVELGSRCPEKGCDRPHHNPVYRLDQDALPYGVQYLYDMALKLLNQ